jgi:serine/threonine-protein kinase HipA
LIERLAAYLGTDRVGTLIADERPGDYSFCFEAAVARARPGEIVISASLPVREAPYEPTAARPFFEGLLPERGVREAIARNLHLSDDNSFGLLAALGRDSAGAVVLLGEDHPFPGGGSVEWLDDAELGEIIARLPTSPLGISGTSKIRLSLAGLQRKAVLVRSGDGTFGLPHENAPSTHILKPQYPDTRYNNIVYNEYFCMRVADCLGLPVPHVEVMYVGETPCLLVERFDRSDAGGTRIRLHQEDFCQALGVPPGVKYQSEGGPGLAESFGLVRDVSHRSGADVLTLIRAICLNFVLGNHDSHAKNFSLLYGESGLALAPLYDLVSTGVYPEVENSLAMALGDEFDPESVGSSEIAAFAERCGLNARGLMAEWERFAGKAVGCAEGVAGLMRAEGLHVPVVDRIVDLARRRAAQIQAAAS